ncbi:MAG: SulP family inorganic anion transporter [Flavobacteriales bacterium]|nr:SulP family inorganic anion transporter [Flavobacteriales bacterium]
MNPTSFFKHWKQDLPASLVVFLVAVPLCLGIALASGAPPIAGLIAGVIGGIVVGGASGSQLGVSGPAAGLAVIVAGSIGLLGLPAFLLAVVLAGAMQLVLGFLGAGVIAYYFPNSVVKGMLSGIGIIIILKQIPHAFGYDKDYEGDLAFIQPDNQNTFSELALALGAITPGAVVIAAVCLGILLLWETKWIKQVKILAQVPGPLLAVIAGIVLGSAQGIMGAHGLATEHYVDLPDLSTGLAAIQLPSWSAITDLRVWTAALTLAIVASLETLLCVEATDKLDAQKRITPTNRELKAQGVGNILSGIVGGLPLTQVIVRSSANIQTGGRTKLSTILHGVWILLALLLFPQLMEMIPLASLAAILFVVGYKLAKPILFKQMWAKGWPQFVPFIITILGVVFTDLLTGVLLGMAVGIFIVLRNNYLTPFHFDGDLSDTSKPIRIELSEEVTFFNKASIQRTLADLPNGTHVVIDGHRTVNLDPDVLEIIEECRVRRKEEGIHIELVGFEKRLAKRVSMLASDVVGAARRKLLRI